MASLGNYFWINTKTMEQRFVDLILSLLLIISQGNICAAVSLNASGWCHIILNIVSEIQDIFYQCLCIVYVDDFLTGVTGDAVTSIYTSFSMESHKQQKVGI